MVVRLLLELQTSDAGAAIALGFLLHDAVPAYAGNANGGWWRYNNVGNGLGVPLSSGPIGDIFLANKRVGHDAVDDLRAVWMAGSALASRHC